MFSKISESFRSLVDNSEDKNQRRGTKRQLERYADLFYMFMGDN